jgi:SurA N-terminal domain
MITFIRSLINSKFGAIFALIFIGMIAVAFALGDVTGSGSFGGLSGGNVARVGDRNITLGELDDALQNRLKAERQNNPTLDMANFVEGGGLDSTLEQLINRYAIAVFGNEYGVQRRSAPLPSRLASAKKWSATTLRKTCLHNKYCQRLQAVPLHLTAWCCLMPR